MKTYLIRLDDACERMDVQNWTRIEQLLDKYSVKPLVGVIPHCEDQKMNAYQTDALFWEKVDRWRQKGWVIALHGYDHVYSTNCGGINPINKRSEFAGNSIEIQKEKIAKGISVFKEHGMSPSVFFAPAHTFDENTLIALQEMSEIRFISDTIAWDSYRKGSFTFVPQQSGKARALPFKTTTFCFHPNTMSEKDFSDLETFLMHHKIGVFPSNHSNRKFSLLDKFCSLLYFRRRR